MADDDVGSSTIGCPLMLVKGMDENENEDDSDDEDNSDDQEVLDADGATAMVIPVIAVTIGVPGRVFRLRT